METIVTSQDEHVPFDETAVTRGRTSATSATRTGPTSGSSSRG